MWGFKWGYRRKTSLYRSSGGLSGIPESPGNIGSPGSPGKPVSVLDLVLFHDGQLSCSFALIVAPLIVAARRCWNQH